MRFTKGFTLIELMIAVAVIAILAAIALPSYTDYIRRGKIPEATTALLAQRVKLEQYFQDNRTYAGACAANTVAPIPVLKHFTVTCPTLTASAYIIQAAGGVAGGDQAMVGITFTINEKNQRASTVTASSTMANAGYSGNPACWVSKKGGMC